MKAVGLGKVHEEIEERKRQLAEADQRRRMPIRGREIGMCRVHFRMLAAADCMVSYIFWVMVTLSTTLKS